MLESAGDFDIEAEAAPGPDVDPGAWRDATPLCARCLEPFDPLQHYCAQCGDAVGQLTPYIPFVNIAWTYSFLDIMWRRLWLDRGLSRARRALYCIGVAVNIIVLAPACLLLLAIPMWWSKRRRLRAAG